MSKFSERVSSIVSDSARCFKEFPVEILYGVTFFVLCILSDVVNVGLSPDGEALVDSHILLFFLPLFVLSFFLNRILKAKALRWIYFLSYLFWIPFLYLDMEALVQTRGFWFTYFLAVILLTLLGARTDNESFGRHLLNVFLQIFFAFVAGIILLGSIEIIIVSANFLFSLDLSENWYLYPALFVLFVIIPPLCCWFICHNSDDVTRHRAVVGIIDYILSPALVIYTALLYAYIIWIIVRWELPKGAVAYVVTAFIAVALLLRLLQYTIEKRHFDWFYKYFTWFAVAPLVLLWVGTLYRIGQYGLTESRFYLLALDGLMTIFVFMLLNRKTRNYYLMTCIFTLALIVFTYIPGISAKDISISSQCGRLTKMIPGLLDPETGKFPEEYDYEAIAADSVRMDKLLKADDLISYLKDEMDSTKYAAKYGKFGDWWFDRSLIENQNDTLPDDEEDEDEVYMKLDKPVDLGDYTLMVPPDEYYLDQDSSSIYIKTVKDSVILEYNVLEAFLSDSSFVSKPMGALVHSNDSLKLVLNDLDFNRKDLGKPLKKIKGEDSSESSCFTVSSCLLFRKKSSGAENAPVSDMPSETLQPSIPDNSIPE